MAYKKRFKDRVAVAVYIERDERDALVALSEQHGLPVSKLIRRAIQAQLRRAKAMQRGTQ